MRSLCHPYPYYALLRISASLLRSTYLRHPPPLPFSSGRLLRLNFDSRGTFSPLDRGRGLPGRGVLHPRDEASREEGAVSAGHEGLGHP